ncbi:GNAT family N-acetyltransferase [Alicyclobacillus acidiphilus]|uniref:GNAT family N-acetyltransferase n=1 Tax=Alicyclobacillus acidiphilus TaxID=182455 RepID=UPI002481199B|nr:GNAT family N-acetyltransferase [Alicyclobacillus acidiphilus]
MLKSPTWDEVVNYVRYLWSDEDTMRDVGGIHPMDEEQAVRWFSAWIEPGQPDRRYFLVMRQPDNLPVGEACFHSYDRITGVARYSMNIEAKHRGHGYGTAAMKLLLRYFFNEFGGREMIDDIAPDNKRAQELFVRFGFEHDLSLAQTYDSAGGDDVYWVRIDKARFQQLYAAVEHEHVDIRETSIFE